MPHVPIFLLINVWDGFVSNCEQILLSTGLQAVVRASISFSPEYAQEQRERLQDTQTFHFTWQWKVLLAKVRGGIYSQICDISPWSCFGPILLLSNLATFVYLSGWNISCGLTLPFMLSLGKIIPIHVFFFSFLILLDLLVVLQWLVFTKQAKWISYRYTYIPLGFPSHQVTTEH